MINMARAAQASSCLSKMSPRWDDELLEAVVSMFKVHSLV
ncbi:hypothetical protein SynRS9915_01790 [Synechococcus sp. RS9915]|nr:hypothetical protein SynRS9915_01790 [Synechococcus sp. RS9915]